MTLTLPELGRRDPAGDAGRFGGRWRFVGAGLSNVWRYGDLDFDAPYGRLLLRGANGTGKTTVLELLWPYLLDLNSALLAAGPHRNTHLSNRMAEGATGRRRVGYVWMSLAPPSDDGSSTGLPAADAEVPGVLTYGARLNYSEGGSPPVRVMPFCVPARPLRNFALWGPSRDVLSVADFDAAVTAAGGTVFADEDDYVRDLASRVFGSRPEDLTVLAARIRHVRNPALLQKVSADAAAGALRESLPGVAESDIEGAGDALAESDATRRAFEGDRDAAAVLANFARVWTGHATFVVGSYTERAAAAAANVARATAELKRLRTAEADAIRNAIDTATTHASFEAELAQAGSRRRAVEQSAEFQDAGRLTELAENLSALVSTADARLAALRELAATVAASGPEDLRHAEDLAEELAPVAATAATADPALAARTILSWSHQPRVPYAVGGQSVDAGEHLSVAVDFDAVDATVAGLRTHASAAEGRANLARVLVRDHDAVAAAERAAVEARSESTRRATSADEADKAARDLTAAAEHAATVLHAEVDNWLADTELPGWMGPSGLDAVGGEPAATLAAAEAVASDVSAWAHARAAAAGARADAATSEAAARRGEAEGLRSEAERIRSSDAVLPLPRPEWASAGDDTAAFGAAVEWVEGVAPDVEDVEDVVEATLAASGLLGATLTSVGASTEVWAVDAAGEPAEPNLGDLLRPEPGHPLADAAAAVLARIAVAPTAPPAATQFTVGLDGTFRAGVFAAAVPDARDAHLRPKASHIGARRRREAALTHAANLDVEADAAEAEAAAFDEVAVRERASAADTILLAESFPARGPLQSAESARAAAANAAYKAGLAADDAEQRAGQASAAAASEARRWSDAVTSQGLPADVGALERVESEARATAKASSEAAQLLDRRLRRRLGDLVERVAAHDRTTTLDELHAAAVSARFDADDAAARHAELAASVGRTADVVLARHAELTGKIAELRPQVTAADRRAREAESAKATARAKVETGERDVAAAEPLAAHAAAELRVVLGLPGVAEAVLRADADPDDQALVAQAAAAIAGKPTSPKKSLRTLVDETKATVAGIWSLDPGPDHPELDTWFATHGAAQLAPVSAAAHAQAIADKAEAALKAAEEKALSEFVVGRLPKAISFAWTALFDWSAEVNKKMREASASSGVGVALRIGVRDDLSPVTRTVYDLACKTGDTHLSSQARIEAGRAIQQLIAAADGDDMTARVRAAVNIRDWVDVRYEVTRPNQPPRTWGRKTALSTGETRLVVLAPMLAAVSAAFDKFASTALRLAALDEVPSDVDDVGREGLARYIATLDLDLVATSHGWDGAPGAWDGVDAFDLEAAPDGTVIAFPILIRASGPPPLGDGTVNGHAVPAV